jgi:hypothetical protein
MRVVQNNRLADQPPVVVPSFKSEWGASPARVVLPKGKRKSWIRKFLELAMTITYQKYQ